MTDRHPLHGVAWVALARHGSPDPAGLPCDLDDRPAMTFDMPSRLERDPRQMQREAWTGAPALR